MIYRSEFTGCFAKNEQTKVEGLILTVSGLLFDKFYGSCIMMSLSILTIYDFSAHATHVVTLTAITLGEGGEGRTGNAFLHPCSHINSYT
jgi:hypothetical protein